MIEAKAENGSDFPRLTVALAIDVDAWFEVGLGDEPAIEAFVRETLAATAAVVGFSREVETEVSVTLSDDSVVREANAAWRRKDRATNILSFPLAELTPGEAPGPLAGDLLLAFQTVSREAQAESKRFADHFRHLVVHGFLHLLGHDHLDEEEAREMESVEVAVLARFGIADPYDDVTGRAEALAYP